VDPGTLIGIALAFVCVFVSLIMEGGNPASLISPSSAVLVFGGTLGAAMAGFLLKDTTGLVNIVKSALLGKVHKPNEVIQEIVGFAEKARREGLLALEEAVKTVEDPFLKKGIELAVDGTDPDELREILETEIVAMKARHKAGAKFFKDLSGFSPTLGIIGTVLGLIHMLENLKDPASAGPAIAVAFTATLYGVMTANLVHLPLANKLARTSELEVHHMELVVEGILSIQAGGNPRVIEQKLLSFLPPKERAAVQQEKAA
jgi:chemotaxis protein MotA